MKNTIQKIFAAIMLCLAIAPADSYAQNAGQQFSLGFYQARPSGDTTNYHTSFRDYSIQPEFALPYDTSRKRTWFSRKLFNEHLLEYNHPDYSLYVSFLPDFIGGRSSINGTNWVNTRGFIAGGKLGKNFTFQTSFFENQAKLPNYLTEFGKTQKIVPQQGTIRPYGSNGIDYNYASALLSYTPSKFLNVQLGYDRNFIGDGYRSMLLSDNHFNYPFLKMTAGAGRLKYMVMWAQMIDLKTTPFSHDNGYPKKWGVFHYLDWNATDKLSIGLFESVIWQDADSTGKRGFDVSYLAPVIFLRPVEFSVGSPDNALMGLNIKYAFTPTNTIYGQFILDEFKFKEMTNGNGWWGNKFGGQLGYRSQDFLNVPKLNFLTEINAARPFTYAQRTPMLNYGHYNQSLAHPLGANFVEWVNIADYQYKRWFFRGQAQYASYGLDSANSNFGKDIFKSYESRSHEFGNKLRQGIKTNLLYLQGSVAYLLNRKYNLRVELSVAGRQEKNNFVTTRELIYQIGFRSTFRQIYYDF